MKKLYIYAFAGLFFLGLEGCKKLDTFGDTNTDPANTTKPVIGALLASATAAIGTIPSVSVAADTNIAKPVIQGSAVPGYYAQYFSETQYPDASLYSLQQTSFTPYYSTLLNDLQVIINSKENNNMTQVSKIMQQYVYWTITDRWGDVPYTEALQGLANLHPKYDKQEDIYKGMFATLKTAITSFDGSVVTGDAIYGGDVTSWKQLANSLRMLMALQLSKKYPAAGAYAATEFNAALTDPAGYITTNDQNFTTTYPGGNFPSPFWTNYNGRKDLAESKTMTDLMASLSDTRQTYFGGSTEGTSATTSNVGFPYGLIRSAALAFGSANTNWARVLRGDLRTQTGSVVIISAAEVTLARAEAASRGWTAESAAGLYSSGITLSFAQWGATVPANYMTQASVALTGGAANLTKIITQEFIASYPDGTRGWNIWRRTGVPVLVPGPNASNASKQIPRRLAYAATEYTSNRDAVTAAAAALPGGDTQDAKVWWDQ